MPHLSFWFLLWVREIERADRQPRRRRRRKRKRRGRRKRRRRRRKWNSFRWKLWRWRAIILFGREIKREKPKIELRVLQGPYGPSIRHWHEAQWTKNPTLTGDQHRCTGRGVRDIAQAPGVNLEITRKRWKSMRKSKRINNEILH